jgi:hypothetical protein
MRPRKNKDAWLQSFELRQKYTKEIEVRKDLQVYGLGTERTVRLALGYPLDHDPIMRFKTIDRNVATMRELAHALLEACDFVEQSNPEWASKVVHVKP